MQITYEFGNRLFSPDPKVRAKNFVKLGPWIALVTAAGWAINRLITPPEKDEEMAERVEQDRLSHMVIGGYLRLPFDYGPIGAVQSVTWNALDNTYLDLPKIKRRSFADAVLKRLLDFPGGPMNLVQPQLRSIWESRSNYRWYYGDNIEPYWMAFQSEPEDRKYWSTPKVYVLTSRWLKNYVPKGTSERYLTPLKLQHLVRSAMAVQIDETVRTLDKIDKGTPVLLSDVPLVGRLIARPPRGWFSRSVKEVSVLNKEHDALKRRYEETKKNLTSQQKRMMRSQIRSLEEFSKGETKLRKMYDKAKRARDRKKWDLAKSIEQEMAVMAREILNEAATQSGNGR